MLEEVYGRVRAVGRQTPWPTAIAEMHQELRFDAQDLEGLVQKVLLRHCRRIERTFALAGILMR
jgi:hypothetical protein